MTEPDSDGTQPDPASQPGVVTPAKPGPSKQLLVIIGAVAVLVILVLILGFGKPGFFKSKELNVVAAQKGVQDVLSDNVSGYGAAHVGDVVCNNGQNPKVKKGATFTCEVKIDGTTRQVTATFVDDTGSYQVSRPT